MGHGAARTVLLGVFALGCNALSGVSDLEKVDCTDCGSGGSAGGGGTAGGAGTTPIAVTVGPRGSCAILADKSLWCWGANPGVEPGTVSTKPVKVEGISAPTQVSMGLEHTCAVNDSGVVYCWGRNDNGQLGDGSTAASAVPKAVPQLGALDTVSVGRSHSCAYTAPGNPPIQTFCWGANQYGQLGDGTKTDSLEPLKVPLPGDTLRLGPGGDFTCAVVDVGGSFDAYCWGRNDVGRCGQDPSAMPTVDAPTKPMNLGQVERVYPGGDHVCARTLGTRLPSCWGANNHGQVGINSTSAWELPQSVVGGYVIDTMSPGARHTCLSTRTAIEGVCFGANDLGQFSGVPGSDQPLPMRVPFLDGFGHSMRRADHGCGVKNDKVLCWGANDSGQLGNGTTGSFGAPVEVSFE
jgi:alpha-tubulin suppressor-like RCC1 family protein